MLVALSTSVFATESNNGNLPPVEIVSPKINANGDVMHTQDLFISLKIRKQIDATLTLVRLDQPRISRSTIEGRMLTQIASNAPTRNAIDESKPLDKTLDPVIATTVKSVFKDEIARDVLQDHYVEAGAELKKAYDAYMIEYNLALKKVDEDILNTLIFQRKLLNNGFKDLHLKRQDYEKAAIIYLDLQKKYESMFRIKVVDHAKVDIEGVLPFFNLTVKDISTGRYELIIQDINTGRLIIDKVNITIKKADVAAQEMIQRVKMELNDIWTVQ
jgi:hypothetical protein